MEWVAPASSGRGVAALLGRGSSAVRRTIVQGEVRREVQAQGPPPRNEGWSEGSGGWGEELEGNVVRVSEGQPRPVRGVDDASVRDGELAEPVLPPLEARRRRRLVNR